MIHGQTSFKTSEIEKWYGWLAIKMLREVFLRNSFISIYRRAGVWPADVIDGNVSELLVHGRLVFFARQEIEGGLGVLIGDIYPNFSRALKIAGQILPEKNILHKLKKHRGITEQV